MLKRMVATTAMAVAFLVGGMVAYAEEGSSELKLDGIKCLFCKMQVKEDVAVDYKGAKIYLGCEGCVSAFKADVDAKMTVMVTRKLPYVGSSREIASPNPLPP